MRVTKQNVADVTPLKEEDAYPADPEPGYGWEKLFTEQLCNYYLHDHGFETRIVRFHNVYGPLGTYDGGKEKAPAAISAAKWRSPSLTGTIESGATVGKRAPLCTSVIASKVCCV